MTLASRVTPDEVAALADAERRRFGVPGAALAVIVDGRTVLCAGLGLRDREGGLPVTAHTLFPIASDTKCVVGAAAAALATDGVLDLDAPVRDYLPWFRLLDPHATELATTRDLLAHRTGLPRHDLVRYGLPDLSVTEVTRLLRHLEPSAPLRQKWQYCNLGYHAAACVLEAVTGRPWRDVVRSRVLDRAGMPDTQFTRPSADADRALPHDAASGQPVRISPEPVHTPGPEGSIVSNARDLIGWLRARLGADGDTGPLSPAALAELHGPAMLGDWQGPADPERHPMGYALGCRVESYRGHRVVRHGGNHYGFSSDVVVAPDDGIGIAILTNLHASAARDVIPLVLLDRLLGLPALPWGERYLAQERAIRTGARAASRRARRGDVGRPPPRPLAEYTGDFEHPAYGVLDVRTAGDELVTDFHGAGREIELAHQAGDVWALSFPAYDFTAPLVFQSGTDGAIASLSVALEPAAAPIVFRRQVVSPPLAELQRYAGEYAMGPLRLTVEVGDHLLVDLAGRGRFRTVPLGGLRYSLVGEPGVVVELSGAGVDVEPFGVFVPVSS